MKKILLTTILTISLAAAPAMAAAAALPEPARRTATASKSLKSIFQSAIGKYPFDVNLLQKPALKARLVKLLGQKRFNTMAGYFDVQSPIEFSNWNYHTTGCQQHNCGSTNFEISYNPEKDALAVRYCVDDRVSVYKEKPQVNASWDY